MKFCMEVLFIVTNRIVKENQKLLIFHGDPFSGDADKPFYQLFLTFRPRPFSCVQAQCTRFFWKNGLFTKSIISRKLQIFRRNVSTFWKGN